MKGYKHTITVFINILNYDVYNRLAYDPQK